MTRSGITRMFHGRRGCNPSPKFRLPDEPCERPDIPATSSRRIDCPLVKEQSIAPDRGEPPQSGRAENRTQTNVEVKVPMPSTLDFIPNIGALIGNSDHRKRDRCRPSLLQQPGSNSCRTPRCQHIIDQHDLATPKSRWGLEMQMPAMARRPKPGRSGGPGLPRSAGPPHGCVVRGSAGGCHFPADQGRMIDPPPPPADKRHGDGHNHSPPQAVGPPLRPHRPRQAAPQRTSQFPPPPELECQHQLGAASAIPPHPAHPIQHTAAVDAYRATLADRISLRA